MRNTKPQKTENKGCDLPPRRYARKENTMTTSKKNAGYSINHEDQTITITKDYAKRSSVPGSKEFRELSKLHAAFPEYTIQRRTATITADKQKHNGLTVDFMEKYVVTFADDAALKEFENAKEFYKGEKAFYGKMKSWFLKKYPNYNEVSFAA